MGFSTNQTIALVLGVAAIVGFASMQGVGPLSAANQGAGGDNGAGNSVDLGTSATVSVAAFDKAAEGSTQVGSNIYAWRENGERIYLGSKSGSASSRSDFTNFVTGSTAEIMAFDSTYTYGVKTSKDVNTEQELVNAEVYKGISTGNVKTTWRDNSGDSTTSVNLGADEQYAFNGIEVKANNNGVTYNPHVVAFDKADSSNISEINMPGAKEIAVPKHLADSYDVAYEVSAFGATEGKPALMAYESAQTGTVEVIADSSGTNGESLTVAVLDKAPFVSNSDEVAFGVEDDADSPSDVGVGDVTDSTLTLN